MEERIHQSGPRYVLIKPRVMAGMQLQGGQSKETVLPQYWPKAYVYYKFATIMYQTYTDPIGTLHEPTSHP